MARADDPRTCVAEQLLHRFGQRADRGRVRLLDEQIAGVRVLERERDQIDRLVQIHQEARHIRVGDRDRFASPDLVDKQRDHRSAAAHHVAVPRAADHRIPTLRRHARVGIDHMLHHRLADAHGVDRIRRLVRRQADDALDARLDRGVQHVVRALDVRLDGLHREKFAGRHLLERRRVENIVDARHRVAHRLQVAHVADIELDLAGAVGILRLQLVAHVVLFLFIARENADLSHAARQIPAQHRAAEAARAARDQQLFSFKHISHLFRERYKFTHDVVAQIFRILFPHILYGQLLPAPEHLQQLFFTGVRGAAQRQHARIIL